ncbi:WXG100 family type VII secretion target [Nocardia sp. alder85J]|uniref:WXG100 family type VII secretion target n=1 Tax=Nocardia sp. alder85J TaxID=2862949 RepID=UPI001CD4AE81|nr:WXG100 family type VII secretion target [Nocardia sp. alder85J]MCX4093029.1 WXG100 family type VII secretion target [Nocardia sp. alder85J]
MTDGVKFVADATKSAQDNLSEAVDNMRATLRRIDDTVNNVSGWSGDAQGAFVGVGNTWGDQSRKLHAALDAISQHVESGSNTYSAQEQDNIDIFKHINI